MKLKRNLLIIACICTVIGLYAFQHIKYPTYGQVRSRLVNDTTKIEAIAILNYNRDPRREDWIVNIEDRELDKRVIGTIARYAVKKD